MDSDTNQLLTPLVSSDETYSLFNNQDYDENWEYFKNILETDKNKLLETEFTGLFEKCSVADFMKFIEEPNSFNVIYEKTSLPRHFPLKRKCPKMPHPFPDLEEKAMELLYNNQ